MQLVGGALQSGGWPSVVSIMANWFGKGKRGLIMGIWNAHTSVGNIMGSVMASILLPPFCGWGWAFIVPGMVMAFAGILVFVYLVPQPSDIPGLAPAYQKVSDKVMCRFLVTRPSALSPTPRVLRHPRQQDEESVKGTPTAKGISFLSAWSIPGVTAFALCLFFSKLVAYTFLYWLPYYIKTTGAV